MTRVERKKQLKKRLRDVGLVLGFIALGIVAVYVEELKESHENPTKLETESEETELTETESMEVTIAPVQPEEPVQMPAEPKILCDWMGVELTEEEFNLLCTTVDCEAGNQDFKTKVMVCLTIFNRLAAPEYPDTLREVIYQTYEDGSKAYAVTGWKDFEELGWNFHTEEAVRQALKWNYHPRDMYFFRTKHYHTFGEPYMQSGTLYFSVKGE